MKSDCLDEYGLERWGPFTDGDMYPYEKGNYYKVQDVRLLLDQNKEEIDRLKKQVGNMYEIGVSIGSGGSL